MNLDDAQKQQVARWINEGLKISEIQKRLESDFGLRPTYMEVRFLLDDLRVMPKDPAPTPPPPPPLAAKDAPPSPAAPPPSEPPPVPGASQVKVTVDQITKPGAVVSGSVTFSDGQSGGWYLDEMGRLGLAMKQKGYRPPPADVEEFQIRLQQELARQGF
jgi:hypothetical protein